MTPPESLTSNPWILSQESLRSADISWFENRVDLDQLASKKAADQDPHFFHSERERSGSVVECLTQDRRAVGSSLTVASLRCGP